MYSYILISIISAIIRGLAAFLVKVHCLKKVPTSQFLWAFYFMGSIWLLGLTYWRWNPEQGIGIELLTRLTSYGYEEGHATILALGLTIVVGILFGISLICASTFVIRALKIGPVGLTSSITSCNTLITILLATFYYGDPIASNKMMGICLILLGIFFLPLDFSESLRIKDKKWYLFVSLALISFFPRNGGMKIITETGFNPDLVLLIGSFVGLLWFTYVIWSEQKEKFTINRLSWVLGAGAGFGHSLGIWMYAQALQCGNANIVAACSPFSTVMVILLAWIMLGERLSMMQLFTVVLILVGVIIIGR